MENAIIEAIASLKDMATQAVVALIGVFAALLGTRALEREQRAHHERQEKATTLERRTAAGHRAMLALDAQRQLAQTLHDMIKDQPEFYKWTVINVASNSVPKIDIGELEFLISGAENKNILPLLVGYQQNCDQLMQSLRNFAEIRRNLEAAFLTKSQLQKMHEDELAGMGVSLKRTFETILTSYADTQGALQKGLAEVVPGFAPIFKA